MTRAIGEVVPSEVQRFDTLNVTRAIGEKGKKLKISLDDPKVKMAKKINKNLSMSVGEVRSTLKISRTSYCRYLGIDV